MECPNETDLVHLPESVFKCISANSNPNPNPKPKSNLNLQAQQPLRENEMTSFSGKYPDTMGIGQRNTEVLWKTQKDEAK